MQWGELRYDSADGLSLFARDYNSGSTDPVPVICLSGLTRNSKEFHALASLLGQTHRVIAADYRGRGRSDYAEDWQTYQLPNELADVIALMDHLSIAKAFFIGTSRGGLIAMLMAGAFKHRMHGVVLNDVGPVIEQAGLARIAGYVGTPLTVDTWQGAADMLQSANPGFDLAAGDWLAFAKTIFADSDGRPVLDYDPQLAKTLPPPETILSSPLPDLWEMFAALDGLPVAAIRGENSDLLSASTLDEMQHRLKGLHTVSIAGRGHTPFLNEPDAIAAIEQTLQRVG